MSGTLLWFLALAAIALAAATAVRRMSSLAGGTRELERLQMDVAGIDSRLAATVGPLVARLDDVRRGACDPKEVTDEVENGRATLRALGDEARALEPPKALADRLALLVWELERAARAADMAAHGVQTLGGVRGALGTEGQVALKRGALGLRHAREAVARISAGLTALTPADLKAMAENPSAGRSVTIPVAGPDDDWLVGVDEPPSA